MNILFIIALVGWTLMCVYVRACVWSEQVKPFVPSSPAKKGTYGYMQLNINGNKNPHGVNGEYTYATQGLSTDRREKVQVHALHVCKCVCKPSPL